MKRRRSGNWGRKSVCALVGAILALGPLACGESMPAPDESFKSAPPAAPKAPNSVKTKGLVPKSIKDRS